MKHGRQWQVKVGQMMLKEGVMPLLALFLLICHGNNALWEIISYIIFIYIFLKQKCNLAWDLVEFEIPIWHPNIKIVA